MALNKIQKFYIEKNNGIIDIDTLAKDVGASVKVVKNYIEKLPKPKPQQPSKITARDFMITQGVGGQKGVAIMTEAASGIGEKPKQSNANALRSRSCITKIFDE